MRQFSVLMCATAAAGLVLLATGCQQAPSEDSAAEWVDEDEFNDLSVRTAFEQQSRNGTVADRSIYPHHFTADGRRLNELGEQRVELLAAAYRDGGGLEVNVPEAADVTEQQHAARVEVVRQELLRRGIAVDAVEVRAGHPGGPGLSSAYVLRAQTVAAAEQLQGGRSRSRAGGSSGQTSSGSSSGSRSMTGSSTAGPYGR